MPFITWSNAVLCTPDEVAAKFSLVGLTQGTSQEMQSQIIGDAIVTAKEQLKRNVINKLQRAFPNTVRQILSASTAAARNAVTDLYSQFHAAGIDALASLSWNATLGFTPMYFAEWMLTFNPARPYYWFNNGAPDATAYQGSAYRGDFLGDTLNNIVYVNYADNPSVDWRTFQPSDLIDYIQDVENVLKDACIYTAAVCALERALSLSTSNLQTTEQIVVRLDQLRKTTKQVVESSIQLVECSVGGATAIPPYNAVKLNRARWIA